MPVYRHTNAYRHTSGRVNERGRQEGREKTCVYHFANRVLSCIKQQVDPKVGIIKKVMCTPVCEVTKLIVTKRRIS